jgi:hypothetical protein
VKIKNRRPMPLFRKLDRAIRKSDRGVLRQLVLLLQSRQRFAALPGVTAGCHCREPLAGALARQWLRLRVGTTQPMGSNSQN